jgi:hypothetical protein
MSMEVDNRGSIHHLLLGNLKMSGIIFRDYHGYLFASTREARSRRNKNPLSKASSFDHLVGAGEQCRWYGNAKRFCGAEVDY